MNCQKVGQVFGFRHSSQLMSLPTGWPVAKSTCQHWTCYPEVAEEACCTCDTTQCHSHDPRSDDMLRATGTQSPAPKIRRNHNCTEKHSLPPNFRLVAIGACANKLLIPSTTSPRQCRGPSHQGDASIHSNLLCAPNPIAQVTGTNLFS